MPRLEHVGIAVDEVEPVLECFDDLLDLRPYKSESVPAQQVRTHFLDAASAKLELLESLDDGSAVHQFLDRRGEGLHHLAFEVDDLNATMQRLREADFALLSDLPQPGADDKRICFVHPKETHGVLVEFCDTTEAEWSPHQVSLHEGAVATYERGRRERPSLLLLHGAGGSTRHGLAPLMRQLESSFHLVGIDLPGHGASSLPPADTLTMDHFVTGVEAVLDSYKLSSASLFGFSLGSAVALQVADAHPDRINRLALFAPNAEWTPSLASTLNAQLNLDALAETAPERAADLRARHEHPDTLFSMLRSFVETLPPQNDAMAAVLKSVAAPTLVAGVDEDPLFSVEATRDVYSALDNARLCILPGTRHSLAEGPVSLLSSLLADHFL